MGAGLRDLRTTAVMLKVLALLVPTGDWPLVPWLSSPLQPAATTDNMLQRAFAIPSKPQAVWIRCCKTYAKTRDPLHPFTAAKGCASLWICLHSYVQVGASVSLVNNKRLHELMHTTNP